METLEQLEDWFYIDAERAISLSVEKGYKTNIPIDFVQQVLIEQIFKKDYLFSLLSDDFKKLYINTLCVNFYAHNKVLRKYVIGSPLKQPEVLGSINLLMACFGNDKTKTKPINEYDVAFLKRILQWHKLNIPNLQ